MYQGPYIPLKINFIFYDISPKRGDPPEMGKKGENNLKKEKLTKLITMSYVCDKCNKPFKDNYALKRHKSRKTPCVYIKDTSGITININYTILNYNVLPNAQNVPKRVVDRAIKMFDEEYPEFSTAKGVVFVRKFLNTNPENRNAHTDPKSAIGAVYTSNGWERAVKSDIVSNCIKQTARTLSDSIDIVGVDCPENMTDCLETMATDSLGGCCNVLTPVQQREIITRLTSVLIK